MAAFGEDPYFDAGNVAPQVPIVPLPIGDYMVVITESEDKPTASGTGSYLQFTMEVIEGDYKGRKLWPRLNLNNPSDEAVSIARAELSAICRAVGVMKPHDSSELHNLPMIVKVGMEKRKDTGELNNKVKGYVSKDQAKAGPAATAKAPTKPPVTPPWKKKKETPIAPTQPAQTQTTEAM